MHNDYSRWLYEDLFGFPETNYLIVIGRPLQALLLNLQFYPLHKVSHFAVARFVDFLSLAAFSFLFIKLLRERVKLGLWLSAALAFGVFTLPSSQVYIVWVNQLTAGILPLIVSAASYLVLDRAGPNLDKKAMVKRVFPAFLIFIASVLLYPPNALVILLFTFMKVLFSRFKDWPETRRVVTRDVVFSLSGLATVFLSHKYVLLPLLAKFGSFAKQAEGVMEHPIYKFSLSFDLHEKAVLFLELSKIAFAGILHLPFGGKAAAAVLAFLISGVAFIAYKHYKSSEISERGKAAVWSLQMALSVFTLALIANSPMLIAKGSPIAQYRMAFVYSAMSATAVLWVIIKLTGLFRQSSLKPIFGLLLPALLIISGLSAFRNVLYTSINANKELNFVREKISKTKDLASIRNIAVISLPLGATFIDKELKHEFKFNTVNWVSVPDGLVGAVFEEDDVRITSVVSLDSVKLGDLVSKIHVTEDDTTIIIDMNKARDFGADYGEVTKTVSIKCSIPKSNPSALFDGKMYQDADKNNRIAYWTADGYPQWVELGYPFEKGLSGYSITCQFPTAMPEKWTVEGSADGTSWTTIDAQDDVRAAAADTFPLKGSSVSKRWELVALKDNKIYRLRSEADAKRENIFIQRNIALERPVKYKYFRFTFHKGRTDQLLINEIAMFGE